MSLNWWSAHHVSINWGLAFEVSIAALLPLLCEEAYYVATVRHVMDKIKETLAYLNPDQIPVIIASAVLLNRDNDNGQSNMAKKVSIHVWGHTHTL